MATFHLSFRFLILRKGEYENPWVISSVSFTTFFFFPEDSKCSVLPEEHYSVHFHFQHPPKYINEDFIISPGKPIILSVGISENSGNTKTNKI